MKNWSFTSSEVCLLCFAWWLVVIAIQLWISTHPSACHVPPFCICAHTATHQTINITTTHFTIPFQRLPCFLVSSFLGERVWEHCSLVLGWFYKNTVSPIICSMPRNGSYGFNLGSREGWEAREIPQHSLCSSKHTPQFSAVQWGEGATFSAFSELLLVSWGNQPRNCMQHFSRGFCGFFWNCSSLLCSENQAGSRRGGPGTPHPCSWPREEPSHISLQKEL